MAKAHAHSLARAGRSAVRAVCGLRLRSSVYGLRSAVCRLQTGVRRLETTRLLLQEPRPSREQRAAPPRRHSDSGTLSRSRTEVFDSSAHEVARRLAWLGAPPSATPVPAASSGCTRGRCCGGWCVSWRRRGFRDRQVALRTRQPVRAHPRLEVQENPSQTLPAACPQPSLR